MNEDINNMIQNYRDQLALWAAKAPPDVPELAAARECLAKMEALGEASADIAAFMARVVEQDLMNVMSARLSALASAGIKAQQAAGTMELPSVANVALAYHKAFESIDEKDKQPRTCAVYERVFELERSAEHAGRFIRMMAEEGLYVKLATVPLQEVFQPIIKESEDLSQPSMAAHNELMVELGGRAHSALEVDYESNRLAELNRVEISVDQLLLAELYYPLGVAIASWLFTGSEENRQQVENSYRHVAEQFGIDMHELFAMPRIRDLIEKVILRDENANPGNATTLEESIETHKNAIRKCVRGEVKKGPPSRKSFRLWDRTYALDDLLRVLRNPERPAEFQK